MTIPRRRLLGLTASGLGLVGLGAGCTAVRPEGRAAETPSAGTIVDGTFRSQQRGTDVGWAIAYPPGTRPGDRLPLVVALHGYGANHAVFYGANGFGLDLVLAELVRAGTPPYAIASIDGGNSYWHPRATGEDAGAMVTEEFLPRLAEQGLRTDLIGMYGFSMGGYGALRLAGLLGRKHVAAVAAVSPALWTTPGASAPGAFDDLADFNAHDVFGHQDDLAKIPVRVDCGRDDGFAAAAVAYRDGFPVDHRPAGGLTPGGHDLAYWRGVAPAELAFLAERLG